MAVKTINGVPIANIKTINGTPLANIKSLLGVDVSSSYITSVQNVSITIANASASNTATITSVNTALAVVFWGGTSSTDTTVSWQSSEAHVVLTNSTTVTATRVGTTGNCVVKCTVVEFTSGAVSTIQAGTIALTAVTTNTATITSVDTARSIVIYLGRSDATGNFNTNRSLTRLNLTNATTVTAQKNNATGNSTVSYMVVEFQSAVIQSIQEVTASFSTANTSDTSTITSVNTANTMLVWGGMQGSSGQIKSDGMNYVQLTNGTTLTFTRNGTGANSRTTVVTVLEFVSGVLNSIQRGSIALASVASNTATITSVNTAKAFATYQGWSTNLTVDQPDEIIPNVALTNATTVTATKGIAGTTTSTIGYEVPEFI